MVRQDGSTCLQLWHANGPRTVIEGDALQIATSTTLCRDITLRGYCQWLQQWVRSYFSEKDGYRLLLAASLNEVEHYPSLKVLYSRRV
ncbi:hypothetical protein BIY29_15140 [Brenneria alni]|uniref:Uncharacterized protein n=1 Tax=Brenneria alni TaxID=71656 RepID=A0A421DL62_9GAMM|nr:hypothetical protein [Brenneria alni]RLM20595.1 hypothetical protein BIY29_15140 [Brenneria alni]